MSCSPLLRRGLKSSAFADFPRIGDGDSVFFLQANASSRAFLIMPHLLLKLEFLLMQGDNLLLEKDISHSCLPRRVFSGSTARFPRMSHAAVRHVTACQMIHDITFYVLGFLDEFYNIFNGLIRWPDLQ